MRIELKNVNTNKLHDELINANIVPDLMQCDGDVTYITISTDKQRAVMDVVAVHDPTPITPPPTDSDRISALETLILQLGGVI